MLKTRPSQADWWMRCHAFAKHITEAPKEILTPERQKAIDDGVVAHEVFETITKSLLIGKWDSLPASPILDVVLQWGKQVNLYKNEWALAQDWGVEETLEVANGKHVMRAQPDCWFIKDHTLYVLEYKNGKRLVQPDCPQMLSYVYALFKSERVKQDTEINKKPVGVRKLVLAVIQPNVRGNTCDTIMLDLTTDVVLREILKVDTAQTLFGEEGAEDKLTYTPGKYCERCPAREVCPEQNQE